MKKNNDHAKRATQRRRTHKLRKATGREEARRQLELWFVRKMDGYRRARR